MTQTNEFAFESQVETILREQSGWRPGSVAEWDQERALFPERVIAFLQDTQPKLWAEMLSLHGDGLKPLLLNTLIKWAVDRARPHLAWNSRACFTS